MPPIDNYKIKQYYKEFKSFTSIKLETTPEINIVMVPKENGVLAYIMATEMDKDPIDLFITEDLCQSNIQFAKSKIFHEFTHVFDAIQLKSLFSIETYLDIMHTYSEFHASQNEMFTALQYRKVPDKQNKFSSERTLYLADGQEISVYDYVLVSLNIALNYLFGKQEEYKSLDDVAFYQKCLFTITALMNFLGKYHVYHELCDHPEEITFSIFKNFRSSINAAYTMLISQKGFDEHYVRMSEWKKLFMEAFYKHYERKLENTQTETDYENAEE